MGKRNEELVRCDHCGGVVPEYSTWKSMWDRCTNKNTKNWKDYGGRGIQVCSRWRSFKNFFVDVGRKPSPQHSLERIDNSGNYEPANCRWATHVEQANNRRTSRHITFNGVTDTIAGWSSRTGLSQSTILARLRKRWPIATVLTCKVRERFRWIEFDGQRKTIGEWAKNLGIAAHTLHSRLDAGWSLDRALTVTQQNRRMLTLDGETLAIGEWATRLGVTITCLISRLDYYGWTIERALTTPAASTNTRKKRVRKQKE